MAILTLTITKTLMWVLVYLGVGAIAVPKVAAFASFVLLLKKGYSCDAITAATESLSGKYGKDRTWARAVYELVLWPIAAPRCISKAYNDVVKALETLEGQKK